MASKWTARDIPDQSGRTVLVTGANSGLGLVTARELARHGASVLMACRNLDKAAVAEREVRAAAPGAQVRVVSLDLGDLDSVRALARTLADELDGLDVLVNNAGLMAPPRAETAQGFESQLGTNHLGHFALTALLFPLVDNRSGRVVSVSSGAHHIGSIDFENLQRERRYFRWTAYGQSKLANLLFALELDRRLRAAGSEVISAAAHPGYAATNLQHAAPPLIDRLAMTIPNLVFAQSAEMGALPQLYAATMPDVQGGMYIGPDGFAEQRGHPQPVAPSKAARDPETARRLWEVSERLTGVEFPVGAQAPA